MGQALYRKYRSRSLSEIVGQEHITTTLANALEAGKVAHAYLLTGPRGVGKTSIARILAHEINSLPYGEESHLDIIEIDAASNNSVEDVRELRDKIQTSPAAAKYKVFIIDEVHMLSRAAFNALLKTLEEPPAHVVFILATTEAHKLPATIVSRTQRFQFRPVSKPALAAHLAYLAKQEGIAVDGAAIDLMAAHGDGSFRDSISLLDQASSLGENVTLENVEQLLGRVPGDEILAMQRHLDACDKGGVLDSLNQLLGQGYEPAMIAAQLGQNIRATLAQNNSGEQMTTQLSLLRDLLDVPGSTNPPVLLEIVLLRHSSPALTKSEPTADTAAGDAPRRTVPDTKQTSPVKTTSAGPPDPAVATAPVKSHSSTQADRPKHDVAETDSATALPAKAKNVSTPTPATTDSDVETMWQEVLQRLKKTHNTLYGIARMAKPSLENEVLTLELNFGFHQKRLSEPKNLAILTTLTEDVRAAKTKIQCILAAPATVAPSQQDAVVTISNIFGGAELLD